MQDTSKKVDYAHAIMQQFKFQYKDRWVSEKELRQKDRLWTKTFSELVKQGFIEKKKSFLGNQYRWIVPFPY
ncbi:MAG: hypothetical protein ABH879_00010 [archaeon]